MKYVGFKISDGRVWAGVQAMQASLLLRLLNLFEKAFCGL